MRRIRFHGRSIYVAFHSLIAFQYLPLAFEQNKGQAPAEVRFVTAPGNYTVSLLDQGADLHLKTKTIRFRLVGTREKSKPRGHTRLDEMIRYIGANASSNTDPAPRFASVKYESIYPDVDLIFYGRRRQLEYDFVLQPGANPRQIRLRIDGADRLEIGDTGDLIIHAGEDALRMKLPYAFQNIDNQQRQVDVRYVLSEDNEVRFAVAEYDTRLPLTIDPEILHGFR